MIDVDVCSLDEAERIVKFLKRHGWTCIHNNGPDGYSGSAEQLDNMGGLRLFNDKRYGFLYRTDLWCSPTTWTQKLQRQIKKGIIS